MLNQAPRDAGLALLGRLAGALSPAGPRARLSILIFHRVLHAPDPLLAGELDAGNFDLLMRVLSRGWNVLPLGESIERLSARSLPARAACVTFDDGYADNCEVALPILQRHGIAATFFVSSGFLDGGRMWNDTIIEAVRRAPERLDLSGCDLGSHDLAAPGARRRALLGLISAVKHRAPEARAALVSEIASAAQAELPDDLMMRAQQVRALHSAGMEIGAHTVSHPILARLDPDSARREMAEGRARLQDITGAPVSLFAYPNGKPGTDFGAEHVAMARELGFRAALSTAWGFADSRSDLYQLPRFTPWDKTPARFALRLTLNLLRRQRDRV